MEAYQFIFFHFLCVNAGSVIRSDNNHLVFFVFYFVLHSIILSDFFNLAIQNDHTLQKVYSFTVKFIKEL